jgi:hypothetical protein
MAGDSQEGMTRRPKIARQFSLPSLVSGQSPMNKLLDILSAFQSTFETFSSTYFAAEAPEGYPATYYSTTLPQKPPLRPSLKKSVFYVLFFFFSYSSFVLMNAGILRPTSALWVVAWLASL